MKEYVAFISYSRKDKEIADWLHYKLEKYRLPHKSGIDKIFPFTSDYFRPVFLDTQDLHVEERPFTDKIKEALKNSTFLIVLCSASSAVSEFVNMEIKYFLDSHDNNYSKIIPLFIDEVKGCIPQAFDGTTIMTRHFPIYNTKLSKYSEANNYCFLQIISYALGLNFSTIYDRYEIETRKNNRRKTKFLISIIGILIAVIAVISLMFVLYHQENKKALERKQKLIEFEKKVFPRAVVHGYEGNFLSPVIKYLKKKPKEFVIYVLMPTNERELTHSDRIEDFEYHARLKYGIDSLVYTKLPTEAKRGSNIIQISKNGKVVEDIYLDFATTSTSFLDIARFKKKNPEYRHTPTDSIIRGYAIEFKKQTLDTLKADSAFVKFYFDKFELLKDMSPYLETSNDN